VTASPAPDRLAAWQELADLDTAAATVAAAPSLDHAGPASTSAEPQADADDTNAEPVITPFTVLIDTREQAPWQFTGLATDPTKPPRSPAGTPKRSLPLLVRTRVATLRTGDYSVELDTATTDPAAIGKPHPVAVERKSLADLWGTLGAGRDRFVAELHRLAELDRAAVIVEAGWPEITTLYPGHPGERSRLSPRSVTRSIIAWQIEFPQIQWIFAGNRRLAEQIAFRWLARWREKRSGQGGADQPDQPDTASPPESS
jgi:ERCC4-type nuclease